MSEGLPSMQNASNSGGHAEDDERYAHVSPPAAALLVSGKHVNQVFGATPAQLLNSGVVRGARKDDALQMNCARSAITAAASPSDGVCVCLFQVGRHSVPVPPVHQPLCQARRQRPRQALPMSHLRCQIHTYSKPEAAHAHSLRYVHATCKRKLGLIWILSCSGWVSPFSSGSGWLLLLLSTCLGSIGTR